MKPTEDILNDRHHICVTADQLEILQACLINYKEQLRYMPDSFDLTRQEATVELQTVAELEFRLITQTGLDCARETT